MTAAAGALRARRGALAAKLDGLDLPARLRPAFVAAQAATVLITWPLWQARSDPPLLPIADWVPQADMGVVVLATLVLVIVRPEAGVVAHSIAIVAAFAMDQTRVQPEVVSLVLVLWGTTRWRYARVVASAHLVTLWIWAGVNKALSVDFMGQSAAFLFQSFPLHPAPFRPMFGWAIIVAEVSIGVSLLISRWRRIGIALAVALHALGLVALLNARWNEAVWPWNVALPLAAFALFWSRREWDPRAIAIYAAFAFFPLGFYAGVVDAYLAHNLYTSNTASALVCEADTECSATPWAEVLTRLNVPFPPEPRLYRAYFEEVCAPGQTLLISPRRTRVLFGVNSTPSTQACPAV